MKKLIMLGLILLSSCAKEKCEDDKCKKDCQAFTTQGGYYFVDRFGMAINSSYSGQYTICRDIR